MLTPDLSLKLRNALPSPHSFDHGAIPEVYKRTFHVQISTMSLGQEL